MMASNSDQADGSDAEKFRVGDVVLCRQDFLYEAKVEEVYPGQDEIKIHYSGWNSDFDQRVQKSQVLHFSQGARWKQKLPLKADRNPETGGIQPEGQNEEEPENSVSQDHIEQMSDEKLDILPVGAEVTVHGKGAKRATIKGVMQHVLLKVYVSDIQSNVYVTLEDVLPEMLQKDAVLVFRHPQTNKKIKGKLRKVVDQSDYSVCFSDGGEYVFRRGLLQHVKTSVVRDHRITEQDGSQRLAEKSTMKEKRNAHAKTGSSGSVKKEKSSVESRREQSTSFVSHYQQDETEIKAMLLEDKEMNSMVPVMMMPPTAIGLKIEVPSCVMVRSFMDDSFKIVNYKDLKEFTPDIINKYQALANALSKALNYVKLHKLPSDWDINAQSGSSKRKRKATTTPSLSE